jgi:hypothetical protein
MIKRSKILLFLSIALQLTTMGCEAKQGGKLEETKSLAAYSQSLNQENQENESSNKELKKISLALKRLTNSLNELSLQEDLSLRSLREKVLSQKSFFPNFVKACETYSPYKILFSNFYRISNEKYVIELQCTMGFYQPDHAYFLYDDSASMKLRNLPLDIFFKSGAKVKKTSVTGLSSYETTTKELTIKYRCDAQDFCGSIGKYKFEENGFVPKVFLVGYRRGERQTKYEQVYP